MKSKSPQCLVGLVLVAGSLVLVAPLRAQVASPPATAVPAWQQAIRTQGELLVAAYEAGDAEKFAELFLPDGEYIDSKQVIYRGREAIQAEFAAYFAAAPTRKMEVQVDELRQLGPATVVEDGRVIVRRGESDPAYFSRYSTTFVQDNGTWKIASLRDLSSDYASPGDRLQSLQWLVGDWIEESEDGVVETSFYWSEDGNFLVGDYSYQVDGEVQVSGSCRIGWDAHAKQVRSWTFDSEGGHVNGIWTPNEEGWTVKLTGVGGDGALGSATNYYIPVDQETIRWRAVDREVGGESLPDVEVTLVRSPPPPAE